MTPIELKQRRTALGLSQRKLAEALGVPYRTLARWERAQLAVRHPRVLRLALDRLRWKVEW